MPNWVYNEMRFKTENDCKKVAELIKSKNSDFDFNNIIPMPPYLKAIPNFGIKSHVQALAYAFSKGKQVTEHEMEAAIKAAYPQIKEVDHMPKLDALPAEKRKPYVLSNNEVITLTRIANKSNYQNKIAQYKPIGNNAAKTYANYAECAKRAIFETGNFDWRTWAYKHWGTQKNAFCIEIDTPIKRIRWTTTLNPTPKIVEAIHEKTNIPIYYIYTNEKITAFAGEMIFKNQKAKVHKIKDSKECYQLAAFMDTINPKICQITNKGRLVCIDERSWDSAQKLNLYPKASLEQEFLNV